MADLYHPSIWLPWAGFAATVVVATVTVAKHLGASERVLRLLFGLIVLAVAIEFASLAGELTWKTVGVGYLVMLANGALVAYNAYAYGKKKVANDVSVALGTTVEPKDVKRVIKKKARRNESKAELTAAREEANAYKAAIERFDKSTGLGTDLDVAGSKVKKTQDDLELLQKAVSAWPPLDRK